MFDNRKVLLYVDDGMPGMPLDEDLVTIALYRYASSQISIHISVFTTTRLHGTYSGIQQIVVA